MANIINLQLRFHPKEIYFPSDRNFSLLVANHRVYYNIEDYEYNGEVYSSITYRIYYIYNGGIGCGHCFCPQNEDLGFHDIDREHIKILLKDNKPVFVYFSAHSDEGKWLKWEECEIYNNLLVVYVARASHANYPKSGTWLRIFGLANDKCSNSGKRIIPILEEDKFLSYNPENEEKCYTLKKRILLPFYLK